MSSKTSNPIPSPQELSERFQNGCKLHENGLLNEAIEIYRELLGFFPDAPLLNFNCGLALYELHRHQEAEEHYLQAGKSSPDDPDIFYNQGLNYRRIGEQGKSVASFKRAIQLGDNSVDCLYNLALCYQDLDDTDEASRLYQQILAVEPGHQSSLNNFAYLCHKSGKTEKAQALYERLLLENPEHNSALYMLNALSGRAVDSAPLSYVEEVFDNYAKDFEQSLLKKLHYRTPQRLWERYRLLFAEEVKEHCLDLGCGTGLAAELFTSCSNKITGVDISEKMLAVAREKNIYRKVVKDDIAHFLHHTRQHYDLILAADVFTYIGDLKEIFTAAYSRSTDNGVFLFSVEESANDSFELKESGRFGHAVSYIEELCQKSGWNFLDSHPSRLRQDKGEWIKGALCILQK